MALLGIDLGGTKTEGIVMNQHGATLARRRIDTPRHGPYGRYDAVIAAIRDLVLALESTVQSRCTVGVCTPGSISARTGLLKNSNTTCLNNRDVKKDIETALDRPTRIENDANCFTLSEATDGAAEGFGIVFGVIMGTGVGGGLVVNGRLLTGHHHIAGEWGHNVLEPGGPKCYCGKSGCVEVFLSGPGMLNDWPDTSTRIETVQSLLEKAAGGNDTARAVLDRFFERFGKALSTVINILDPDAVVLGGGLSNIPELYSTGVDALARHVFNEGLTTPVVQNRHGDSSGVRGAARLWDEPTEARPG